MHLSHTIHADPWVVYAKACTDLLKTWFAGDKRNRKINIHIPEFDIKIIDHLILTSEGYFAFPDEGPYKHINGES